LHTKKNASGCFTGKDESSGHCESSFDKLPAYKNLDEAANDQDPEPSEEAETEKGSILK